MPDQDLSAQHGSHVAATFRSYQEAEDAVRKLIDHDVPVAQISLVGRNFSIHEKPLGYTTIAGVAAEGSRFGALWGGILGLLLGFTVFFAPAAGPLLLFGPIAYALTTAVEGAVFGGLAGILIGWGLKREKAIQFERSIEQGEFLVVVSGDDDLVDRAYFLLQGTGASDVQMFSGRDQGAEEPA
jgi:outer membrane lipoprotein SlyB